MKKRKPGRPPAKEKTKVISVRIPESVYNQLPKNKNQFIKKLISKYMEDR